MEIPVRLSMSQAPTNERQYTISLEMAPGEDEEEKEEEEGEEEGQHEVCGVCWLMLSRC